MAAPPACANGLWSEIPLTEVKTKPHKEVETSKEAKKRQEWVGGAKEETKAEEWKKWGINLLFILEACRSSLFHFVFPALAPVSRMGDITMAI